MAWWTGDGEATDSQSRYNARPHGAVTYAAGMVGQAFHFDGTGFVKVPTSDLDPGRGRGFTLEMWVKPDDLAQARPLAGWNTSSTAGVSLWIEPALAGTPAILGADLRDSQGGSHRMLSDAALLFAGQWQHVALTYDRDSGTASLYVNGRLARQRHIGDLEMQTSLDFTIGKGAPIKNVTFKGAVDEVSVFSRSLDAAHVQAIYAAGSAGKQLLCEGEGTLTEEERWSLRQKRLSSFAAKQGGRAMSFAADIDGSDFVHIQGDKVWFVHRSWELPGKHGGSDNATRVNGAEWFPQWDGNTSDKCTLTSALPRKGEPLLGITVLKPQGDTPSNISIVQKPAAANNYEAILLLNDDQDSGTHWFIFSLSWDAATLE